MAEYKKVPFTLNGEVTMVMHSEDVSIDVEELVLVSSLKRKEFIKEDGSTVYSYTFSSNTHKCWVNINVEDKARLEDAKQAPNGMCVIVLKRLVEFTPNEVAKMPKYKF